jgi:hypothetical protein
MKKLRLPTPSRRCIFCNASGVTIEHVWPKWLRAYVPATAKQHAALSGLIHRQHSERAIRRWAGDPQSRGIKAVCRGCNGGWMSQLEERAKPVLLPLLAGQPRVLSQDDQRVLASWATMHVMVAEFFAPERIGVPDIDRHLFWMTRQPLPNWKIWIGNYRRGKWVGYWVHNALAIGEEYVSYSSEGAVARSNTQTTTFVVGQLYIHAFSCSSMPELVDKITLGSLGIKKLAQIAPVKESVVVWPPDAMTNGDADRMAGEIFTELNRIGDAAGV